MVLRPQPEQWTPAGPIRPVGHEEEVEGLELHARATVADAIPLGLAAFAAGNFVVSAVSAGWAPIGGLIVAIPVLLVYAGITQFIAGMWSFRKSDTFAATTFGTFGAFNTLFATALLLSATGFFTLDSISARITLGITLAMFALISAYLAYAGMGISPVVVAILGFLAAEYALLSAGFFIGIPNPAVVAGGYCGIVSSLLAFYGSAAVVINSVARREVLYF